METVLLQCPVLSQGPEVQLYSCHQNTYQKQSISPLMVRVLALVPCWQFLYQVGIMYELVYCSCCTTQLCYCMYICVHVINALFGNDVLPPKPNLAASNLRLTVVLRPSLATIHIHIGWCGVEATSNPRLFSASRWSCMTFKLSWEAWGDLVIGNCGAQYPDTSNFENRSIWLVHVRLYSYINSVVVITGPGQSVAAV